MEEDATTTRRTKHLASHLNAAFQNRKSVSVSERLPTGTYQDRAQWTLDPACDVRLMPASGYAEELGLLHDPPLDPTTLSHILFLVEKDLLGQDSFLIGPPGSYKLRVALAYAEMFGREVEHLVISQDTTVSDVKQRRELLNQSAIFSDGPAVRAAVHGRVLILDGIERAERNVLSVLNNLIENREMHLEDGSFLTNPMRYDSLVADAHDATSFKQRGMIRVSDKFRVIALGTPVPEYSGNPLDPPFRSRFQCRNVIQSYPRANHAQVQRLVKARESLEALAMAGLEGLAPKHLRRAVFGADFFHIASDVCHAFPLSSPRFLAGLIFPNPSFSSMDPVHRQAVFEIFERHGLIVPQSPTPPPQNATTASYKRPITSAAAAHTPMSEYRDNMLGPRYTSQFPYHFRGIITQGDGNTISQWQRADTVTEIIYVPIKTGSLVSSPPPPDFHPLPYHIAMLDQMLAMHACNLHFCLVGARGVGKSALVRKFASMLGYDMITMPLHRDMTSQDLFMRRCTLSNGDTVWTPSPLLVALQTGSLCVLDAIEQVPASTLSTLGVLLRCGECPLPNGNRVVSSPDRICHVGDVVRHAAFRVVSLARPVEAAQQQNKEGWLTVDAACAFAPFLWIRALDREEEMDLVIAKCGGKTAMASQQTNIDKLLTLAHTLRSRDDDESKALAQSLSTRQITRLAKRLTLVVSSRDGDLSHHHHSSSSLYSLIGNACLWKFLPALARQVLEEVMKDCDITDGNGLNDGGGGRGRGGDLPPPRVELLPREIRDPKDPSRTIVARLLVGGVVADIRAPRSPSEAALIPDTLFFENVRQTQLLEQMLFDFQIPGVHLLLMGNQGAGKNKLVDRMLHLLRLPREYIQLHRDTTVNELTSLPVVQDGVVKFEDSPLVIAAKHGRVLVIDEADKAPTHVTAVLKSLLADGEMLLSDGRRLCTTMPAVTTNNANNNNIHVHGDFKCIVLANRPGFPFLGNDLFRETGDIFGPHIIDNPDEESELQLLKKYAPSIPDETLRKLTAAFQDLRGLVDAGKLQYPYSTRELVNAIRHMEHYPRDGLANILQNVFDFDKYSRDDRSAIGALFERHGIPVDLHARYKVKTGDVIPLPPPLLTETWHRTTTSPMTRCGFSKEPVQWRPGKFDIRPVQLHVPVVRHEGRATTFDEQLFSFLLPTVTTASSSGTGVIGSCTLSDDTLVVAANDSFSALRLYVIHPPFREFDAFDVSLPHFNFRGEHIPQVRRPSPTRVHMSALPGFAQLLMYAYDDYTTYLLDLDKLTFTLCQLPMEHFRALGKVYDAGKAPGLWAERQRTVVMTDLCPSNGIMLVYQQESRAVMAIDLFRSLVTLVKLPVFVDVVDVISERLWLIHEVKGGGNSSLWCLHGEGGGIVTTPSSRSTTTTPVSSSRELIMIPRRNVNTTDFMGMDYDGFVLELVTIDGITQLNDGTTTTASTDHQRLHGSLSFLSPNPMPSSNVLLVQGYAERRAGISPGTLAQVLEGIPQVFDHHGAIHRAVTSSHSVVSVQSYLRTSLAAESQGNFWACAPVYVRTGSLLCSVSLKPGGFGPKRSNSERSTGGYFGFGNDASLEIVDLAKNIVRHIKMDLPDTNPRRGSAVLFEKFDPDRGDGDGPSIEEATDGGGGGDDDHVPFDVSRVEPVSVSRQRAPFVWVFELKATTGDVLVMDRTGVVRVFQLEAERLDKALESWKAMIGSTEDDELSVSGDESDDDEDEDGEDGDEEDEDGDDDDDNQQDNEDVTGDHDDDGDGDGGEDGERRKKGGGAGKSRKGKGKGKSGGASRRGGVSSSTNGRQRRRRRGGAGNGDGQQPSSSRNAARRRGNGRGGGQAGSGGESGRGSGGTGGNGEGDGAGSGMDLPEPGQMRDSQPRPLSGRDRATAQARIEELRRLTRYFPNDEGIRDELERLEARVDEADEAERGVQSGDDGLRARIERTRKRLERVEETIRAGANNNTTRLQAEAQQLRELLERLENELREGRGGEGGKGVGGRGGRGSRGLGGTFADGGKEDEDAKKEAKRLGKDAWKNVLESLKQNPQEVALYGRYKDSVANEIRELRSTLEAMQAKRNERVWLKNKDAGDLDDRRLVDGLTGERNIYKKRGDRPPDPFAFQELPKKLTFLFDVSSSMSRYSFDGRLERSLESATMVMEAFKGFEHKFQWKFKGHSGSTDELTFVQPPTGYPKDDVARLEILRRMNAHADTCGSGDNTLEASKRAILEITKEDADEYFVILFSDANLEQYSIAPSDLKALLDLDARVNLFILFIGSMGQQAHRLRQELPQDRVFVTLSTSQIPAVLKRIFLSSILKEAG